MADRSYADSGHSSPVHSSRRISSKLKTPENRSHGIIADHSPLVATAAHILDLAKQAEFLYQTQDPREQRRLLETVLSNCTFDRGTLCPTYSSPFDLLVRGNKM
jgi:hypothetical protein